MDNLKTYNDIFRDILEVSDNELNDSLTIDNCDLWDSVHQLMLIASIENEFGITMEPEDMLELTSYKAGKGILKKYGIEI